MHINKAIYTFSYMCIAAGSSDIIFAEIYLMLPASNYCDRVDGEACIGHFFILIAYNLLQVILHGFYWGKPQNNILNNKSMLDKMMRFCIQKTYEEVEYLLGLLRAASSKLGEIG